MRLVRGAGRHLPVLPPADTEAATATLLSAPQSLNAVTRSRKSSGPEPEMRPHGGLANRREHLERPRTPSHGRTESHVVVQPRHTLSHGVEPGTPKRRRRVMYFQVRVIPRGTVGGPSGLAWPRSAPLRGPQGSRAAPAHLRCGRKTPHLVGGWWEQGHTARGVLGAGPGPRPLRPPRWVFGYKGQI